MNSLGLKSFQIEMACSVKATSHLTIFDIQMRHTIVVMVIIP